MANKNQPIKELAPSWLIYSIQITIVFVLFRIFNKFFAKNISIELNKKDIKANQSYLITPNHQSNFDPFVICAALPFSALKKLLPIYFMTKDVFFKKVWLRPFLKVLGCFHAKRVTADIRGLDYAQYLLHQERTIMIFPEGTRTKSRNLPARRGVAALTEATDVAIIPAYIGWRKWHRFSLAVGKPYQPDEPDPANILDQAYQQEKQLLSAPIQQTP